MLQAIVDGGPRYVETDLARSFPVEPWNTVSNLATTLCVVYWLWALRGRYREHPLVTCALPCLFTASVGATLYHGLRSSRVFLFLDFVPNLVLGALLVFVFWRRYVQSAWRALFVLLGVAGARGVMAATLPAQISLNVGNALIFVAALVPVVPLLARTHWHAVGTLLLAAASFALAIVARTLDPWSEPYLPMGSHFLWHVFGGLGTFLLIRFLVVGRVLAEGSEARVESMT